MKIIKSKYVHRTYFGSAEERNNVSEESRFYETLKAPVDYSCLRGTRRVYDPPPR